MQDSIVVFNTKTNIRWTESVIENVETNLSKRGKQFIVPL